MTIKNHGGVFGRNPTFNDVSVETLSIAGTALSSTAAELNILDGVTADATEINYLDGASTSAVTASKAVLANASGNIAFANGNGIDFSASAGGGESSSIFDDYEEGTFTIEVLAGQVGSDIVTANAQNFAKYVKTGNVVYITWRVNTSSASTEDLVIENLPFTIANESSQVGVAIVLGTEPHCFLALNTTQFRGYNMSDGTNTDAVEASGVYRGSLTYLTS